MGALFRNVVYPAWHWAKRDGVNQAIRELERNQWLATADVLSLQQRKLARVLSFAGKNVPYYRALLGELGINTNPTVTVEQFQRIPPLTKETIRHEQDALVSEDLAGNGLLSNSTSGSTGEVLRFYTDLRSTAYRKAAGLRSNSWTGWRLGDRAVSLWGAPIDEQRAGAMRGRLHGLVTAKLFLSSFDLSKSKMDEYIEKIRDFRPVLFFAYPGPLEQFAIHCSERGVEFPSIRGILSSAETLWPHQRKIIEEAFGAKVFDQYGCREVSQIGTECEAHDGFHISVDRLLVEVVDEEDRPCPPTEEGRILVTDLDNFGMPLIRYDIGDRGVMGRQQPCSCGRGLPRLEKVEGRTLDIVHTPDGRQVGGTFWTLLLRSRRGLRQFQVVQDRLDGVVINFVRDADFNDAALAYFTAKIQECCGPEFSVEFAERESIELTGSGKQRLIKSLLPSQTEISGVGRR